MRIFGCKAVALESQNVTDLDQLFWEYGYVFCKNVHSECGLLCAFRGQNGPKCLELRQKTMQI